jgi:pectate lyase
MGAKVWADVGHLYRNLAPPLAITSGPSTNIVISPLALTDSNADGLANDYTWAASGGAATITREAGTGAVPGYWHKVVVTTAGVRELRATTTAITPAAGDIIEAFGRIEITAADADFLCSIKLRAVINGSGVDLCHALYGAATPVSGVWYARIKAPANLTAIYPGVVTSGGLGTYRFAQPTVIAVPS